MVDLSIVILVYPIKNGDLSMVMLVYPIKNGDFSIDFCMFTRRYPQIIHFHRDFSIVMLVYWR